jgi:hypothetical protein
MDPENFINILMRDFMQEHLSHGVPRVVQNKSATQGNLTFGSGPTPPLPFEILQAEERHLKRVF